MNLTKSTTITWGVDFYKIFFLDIVILIAFACLPTIFHFIDLPLYIFEPMRLFLIAGYFSTNSENNAYSLAICIPLFSFIYSGHPSGYKLGLIISELVLNIFIMHKLFNSVKFLKYFAILISIFISKGFYYLLKFIMLHYGFMTGNYISIDIRVQILVAITITILFSPVVFKKQIK